MADRAIVDRFAREQEGIDVLLATLDAERFLAKSLRSLYAEIPVRRLLVCDGGSKDRTLAILRRFPRLELHVRPDIRTTGKAVEFLISKAKTEWIMFTDADLTFPKGWYDEMCKYRDQFDAFDSRRIHAYEFYREDVQTTMLDERPLVTSPQMGRRKALENFKVDDDYMWRIVDIGVRQAVEKNGSKYGKVITTFHYHHTTEETKYASDPSKAATKIVFERPKEVIIQPENFRKRLIDNAKAYVKYIDPDLPYVKRSASIDRSLLPLLDRQWVLDHGPAWIKRFDEARKTTGRWQILSLLLKIDSVLHAIDGVLHRKARRWLLPQEDQ